MIDSLRDFEALVVSRKATRSNTAAAVVRSAIRRNAGKMVFDFAHAAQNMRRSGFRLSPVVAGPEVYPVYRSPDAAVGLLPNYAAEHALEHPGRATDGILDHQMDDVGFAVILETKQWLQIRQL